MNTLSSILRLTRINRPIGTFLIIWPALSALLLAKHGKASLYLWLVVIIGGFLVRSAGCCINDYFDRDFDLHVERTKDRPLTNGNLSSKAAITIAGLLFAAALAIALTLNHFTWIICAITFALTCLYPLSKRIIVAPQLVLGFTFNMGILIAFAASSNSLPTTAWMFYIANLFFTLAYDTQYAIVDRKDDTKINIHSTALLFGKNNIKFIISFELIAITLLIAIGVMNNLNILYYIGIIIALGYILQQAIKMPKLDDKKYFLLFKQHNIILFWIMLGLAANYYFG